MSGVAGYDGPWPSVYIMGRRDGRYGLDRFPHVPPDRQAIYDAGYAAGELEWEAVQAEVYG